MLHCFFLRFDSIYLAEHQAGKQHSRETAGHSQALIVGFIGQEKGQHIVGFACLSEMTIAVASNIYVCNVLAYLVCQIDSPHTLRAIARAGKTDKQQRAVGIEVVGGIGHQIGGSHGTHILPCATQNRCYSITNKSRSTRARENDVGIGSKILMEESLHFGFFLHQNTILFEPHCRLLQNLFVCKCIHDSKNDIVTRLDAAKLLLSLSIILPKYMLKNMFMGWVI